MKSFIDIVEDRIDDIGSMISKTNTGRYENILNTLKEVASPEILDLVDNLEGAIIDNHRVFEIAIYKQGLKDGIAFKESILD